MAEGRGIARECIQYPNVIDVSSAAEEHRIVWPVAISRRVDAKLREYKPTCSCPICAELPGELARKRLDSLLGALRDAIIAQDALVVAFAPAIPHVLPPAEASTVSLLARAGPFPDAPVAWVVTLANEVYAIDPFDLTSESILWFWEA